MATRAAMGALGLIGRGKGALRSLPLAGDWTEGRDLPLPQPGGTFMTQYTKARRERRA
jgi:L-lactate dehydrogenase complex protein LldF